MTDVHASENTPWQPPPEGIEPEQGPLLLPQEVYDQLMALPPGTDVTDLFEFEPGWDLTVTTVRTGMSRPTYTATAAWDGTWYVVDIQGLPPGMVGVTQGKDLDDAESMAREAISLLLEVEEDSFDLVLTETKD